MALAHLDIPSPVGALRITSDGAAVVALNWVSSVKTKTTQDWVLLQAAKELAAYFSGSLKRFSVPVRPHGTVFQQSVWRAMQKIPAGKTKSYGEVAAALDSGARAVGTACGKNPIPIIIPCHRILGAGGGLGGYSGAGGIPTKQFLLCLESRG